MQQARRVSFSGDSGEATPAAEDPRLQSEAESSNSHQERRKQSRNLVAGWDVADGLIIDVGCYRINAGWRAEHAGDGEFFHCPRQYQNAGRQNRRHAERD